MKKVAFIGAYDKTDMLIYLAKILTLMNKKVLLVDNTTLKKSRYIVPTMTPTAKYVTTYDGIDIAIGFCDMQDLQEYLGIANFDEYDYIVGDIAYSKLRLIPISLASFKIFLTLPSILTISFW